MRQHPGNFSSALPLTDWTNVIVQGEINLFENGLKVFVNGNLCPAEAGTTPSDCGWQIGFENGQPVFPENYAAIRHIRTYAVKLTAQQAMMIAGNPCLDYDMGFDDYENFDSYPVTWNAFNWSSDDVPGEGDGTSPEPVYPDHKMATSYAYNTLGQVTQQKTPDAGISKFWYDYLGRLILSQNAEQLAPVKPADPADRLAYTKYDPFSRVEEVGELLDHGEIANKPFLNNGEYEAVFSGASKRQVTATTYDHAPDWLPAGITLDNLRKRVSGSSFSEDGVTRDQKTYYSYDQIGNVKTLWQDVKGLNEAKRIDYDYDLASGKVNHVRYQGPGKNDRFMYGYLYDAENRLVTVENSANALSDGWELESSKKTQAKYYYYPHGPLSRVELGEQNIQGIDYAYTLQGWLKGINGNFLETDKDMGGDGDANGRPTFAKDVFAYSLNYYNGDYTPLNASANRFALQFTPSANDGKGLYSGNIYGMTVAMDFFRNKAPVGYTYGYDQLNRLKQMRQQEISTSWTPGSSMAYAEDISYDGNGNILQYQRNGSGVSPKPLGMDQLSYTYATINGEKSNRLASVTDSESPTDYQQDLKGSREYTYDKIGNLVSEAYTDNGSPKEDKIYWNVYGKIRKVELGSGGSLEYGYDVSGNRVYKIYTKPDNSVVTTWYVRDAQGNALGTYKREGSQAITWAEQQLYGSSRLGYWIPDMDVSVDDVSNRWESEGNKRYELTNHLGNVMAVLNDTKTGTTAGVLSMQDYYPFGSAMPGRYGKKLENGQVSLDVEGSGYRYGFNGKENDNEVKGEGNQVAFEARVYDPRVGVFLSVDPLSKKYPGQSPYVFAANNPIRFIDVYGMGPQDPPSWWGRIKLYGQLTASLLSNQMERTTQETADMVMPSLLGALNGLGRQLSFGLYGRSPEDIGLSERYHDQYNTATKIFQSAPLPITTGGAGMAPKLVTGGSQVSIATSKDVSIQVASTVLASATDDQNSSGDEQTEANSSGSESPLNGEIGNRFNHIFGKPEHALDDLVTRFGSQENAFRAVQQAADKALKAGQLTPNKQGILPSGDKGNIVDVLGMPVRLIGGRIDNDKVIISSFSRKDL